MSKIVIVVTGAQIICPRVSDWPEDKPLPPWKLMKSRCYRCGAEVWITEDYFNEVIAAGFKEIKIICVTCAAQQPRIAG